MSKLTLALLLLFYSSLSFAQSEIVYYYSSRKLDNEVSKEKAKFSETIIENDTVKTRTVRDLKKNEIASSTSFKGDEPVGIWVVLYGSGPRELDYNFKVSYSSKACSDGEPEKIDYLENDGVNGYNAPTLAGADKSFTQFLAHNLVYPSTARREGIQGRVGTSFTITKEGTVENIVVTKRVDLVLDKEAVRVLRKLKFATPPMQDGEAKSICVRQSIGFKLEE